MTFQCDQFFFPVGVFSGVCTSGSVWDPLPAGLVCVHDGEYIIIIIQACMWGKGPGVYM